MDLARAPCRAPLTARKKGSGYENAFPGSVVFRPQASESVFSSLGFFQNFGARYFQIFSGSVFSGLTFSGSTFSSSFILFHVYFFRVYYSTSVLS